MTYAGKRLLDLVIAIPTFVITSPIQVAAGVAVLINMGSPAIFRQQRPGQHAEPFEMIKLRTMRSTGPSGSTEDASRLTRVGQFLRSTSIDELPTLLNVVRGEMSLVGPRPLLMEYLDEYTPEQARRHDVKPGLTGLAQVNGRNAIAWSERLRLDLDYVDNHSFGQDLKILALTALRVVQRRGIAAPGAATMPRFRADGKDQ